MRYRSWNPQVFFARLADTRGGSKGIFGYTGGQGASISPAAMSRYYQEYFFARSADMSYPLARDVTGRDDDLLNLLGANEKATSDYAQFCPNAANLTKIRTGEAS